MTRPPEFVTFTGADAWTDPGRMLAIQEARGRVEWGILFSPKMQGEGRYPPPGFVEGLSGRGLALAAHVCGGHAREALATGRCAALDALPRGMFRRIQVNTREAVPDTAPLVRMADAYGASRIVLQARGAFPDGDAVDWLQDASGGTGAMPERWPEAPAGTNLVGYAGGLGPDTVAAALPAIAAAAGDVPYYIDMETRVRVGDRFSLDACERVLDLVYDGD